MLDVNLTGVFLMSRAVARTMRRGGQPGSIVSIASIGGKRGGPGIAHYCASKFAVIGFTQSLAMELATHAITVNAICPGLVDTRMIHDLAAGLSMQLSDFQDRQLVARPQLPEEIAEAILFVHRNRSVTGQAINIDGGTVFC